MSTFINWAKGNPITLLCAVVIILGIGAFGWVVQQGAGFRTQMAETQKLLDKIEGLKKTRVEIPSEDPFAKPRKVEISIDGPAIEKFRSIHENMAEEYRGIFDYAVAHNRARTGAIGERTVMLDGLFPEPESPDEQPFMARLMYIRSFASLYELLDAGVAPTKVEIDYYLNAIQERYASRGVGVGAGGGALRDIDDEQLKVLEKQARSLESFFSRRALRYHVYADPMYDEATGGWARTGDNIGIFQILPWAFQEERPAMADIWEGQMQLWIQEDLVDAIRIANDCDNPEESLIKGPVKRILSMQVRPGYIGISSSSAAFVSAMQTEKGSSKAGGAMPGGFGAGAMPGGGYGAGMYNPGMMPTPGGASGTSADPSSTSKRAKLKADQPLPDDFALSPSGRASNPIYDVRHAELRVIVDSRRIPTLLEAIGKVNFMTVIDFQMKDVDEYADLRDGYYYGVCDAVQLTLVIESVWLREWTAGHKDEAEAQELEEPYNAGLMPDAVRLELGLEPRDPDYKRRMKALMQQM